VNPLVCHRCRRDALTHPRQRDARALGRQDHTTSPSAIGAARQVQPLHVHRIPAPHLVTIAKRPSASEAGWRDGMLIFGNMQARYFCGPILNKPVHLIPLEKFRFTRSMDRQRFAKSSRALEQDRMRSRPTGESPRVSARRIVPHPPRSSSDNRQGHGNAHRAHRFASLLVGEAGTHRKMRSG